MFRTLIFTNLLIVASVVVAEQNMQISVDRKTIYQGDSFALRVSLPGRIDEGSPQLKATFTQNTTVRGPSVSQNIYNGKASHAYTYQVTPSQAGLCKLIALTLTIKNKAYTAQQFPSVTIKPPDTDVGVTLSLTTPTPEVMIGETFTVMVDIHAKMFLFNEQLFSVFADTNNPAAITVDLPDDETGIAQTQPLQLNERSNGIGFTLNNIVDRSTLFASPRIFRLPLTTGKDQSETYRLDIPFKARKEGVFTIPAVRLRGQIVTGVSDQGDATKRTIYVSSQPLSIKIVSPPSEGRPDSFIGVICSKLQGEAKLGVLSAKTGDPLQLTLTLRGDFEPFDLQIPRLPETKDFRIYQDNVISKDIEGGRSFTYRVRPLTAGTIEFPAIELSYFDQLSRTYQTVKTIPIPLQVIATAQIAQLEEDEDLSGRALPCGIIYDAGEAPVLLPDWRYMIGILGCGLLYLLRTLYPIMRVGRQAWQKQRLRAGSAQRAIRQMKHAKTPDVVAEAIRTWLSCASLTVDDLVKQFQDAHVAEADIILFSSFYTTLEAAVYNHEQEWDQASLKTVIKRLPVIDKQLIQKERI